jgi:hypothetical protein
MKPVQSPLGKVWKLAEAFATLLVLLEALTNPPPILKVLVLVAGEYASIIYDLIIVALLALFGVFCFQIGVQHEDVPLIKKLFGFSKVPESKSGLLSKSSEKPEAVPQISPIQVRSGDVIPLRNGEPVRVTVSLEPERQILLHKGYQSLIREDLFEIRLQYQRFEDAQKIYFKSWNETNATLKRELIGKIGDTDVLYDTVEEISKILNWWNNDVDRAHSLTYQVNNGKYLQGLDTHYKTLKTIGFLPTWFSV